MRQERDEKTRTYRTVTGTGNSRGENTKVPPLTYTVAGRVQVVFPRVRKAKRLLSTKDWAITYQTIELCYSYFPKILGVLSMVVSSNVAYFT